MIYIGVYKYIKIHVIVLIMKNQIQIYITIEFRVIIYVKLWLGFAFAELDHDIYKGLEWSLAGLGLGASLGY